MSPDDGLHTLPNHTDQEGHLSTIEFSIRKRDVAWMTALVLLLTTIWVVKSDPAVGGGDPPAQGIDVVYVTTGTNYPDALGVGPGAALNGAPIILVPTNPPLHASTIAELVRLDPKAVIIIGGTSAVSTETENDLKALLPNASFERLAGSNRYVTNTLLTQSVYPVEGWAAVGSPAFTGKVPATDNVLFGGFGMSVENGTGGEMWASIQLPHGATVLELVFSGYDDEAGAGNVTVSLVRVNSVGGIQTLAIDNSEAAPTYFTVSTTDIDANFEVVDNESYFYALIVTGINLANNSLHGVKVRYRLGTP